MWIVCQADDSHEMSRRFVSENYKKKSKESKLSAAVLISALRVNIQHKVQGDNNYMVQVDLFVSTT